MRVLTGFTSLYLYLTAASSFGDPSPEMAPLRISGYALPQPLALQSFRLVDQHGYAFTLDDLRNRWTLLFFA